MIKARCGGCVRDMNARYSDGLGDTARIFRLALVGWASTVRRHTGSLPFCSEVKRAVPNMAWDGRARGSKWILRVGAWVFDTQPP